MFCFLPFIKSKARHLATVAEKCRVHPGPMTTSVAGSMKGDGNIYAEGGQSVVEDYVMKFTGDFMEVVRCWAEGISFADLIGMSKIFAGSVIRCLRRLDELLKQMHSAAKVAGNVDLEIKFTTGVFLTKIQLGSCSFTYMVICASFFLANALIKRDIVFAASLYL